MDILGVIIFLVVLMLAVVFSVILAVIAGFLIYTFTFFARVWLILLKRRLLRWVSPNVTDAPGCST